MKKSWIVISILFVFAVSGIPAGASGLKSILRTEDSVVVEGSVLQDLMRADIQHLSLLRYHSGVFQPVPFQIDQRHADGLYAFTFGKEARMDADPTFDKNDELAFMINDLGDEAPKGKLPPGAVKGMELVVVDPLDSGKGWVYLCSFQENPPRSQADYISMNFDPENKRKRFEGKNPSGNGVAMGAPMDAVTMDEMRFFSQDGKETADFLDRLKIRGNMRLKAIPFTIPFKVDQLIREDIKAWIDGPVRGIYRGTGYFDFTFFKVAGKGYEEISMYRNRLDTYVVFQLPFKISTFLKDFSIIGYMDYNEHICDLGFRMYTNANPPSSKIIIDGKTSEDEKNIDFHSSCDWIVYTSPLGAMVVRMFFPEDKAWEGVKKRFHFKEDLKTPSPPEDFPGEIAVGIRFDEMEKVQSRTGALEIVSYHLEHLEIGQEKMIINILDHPVEVMCNRI